MTTGGMNFSAPSVGFTFEKAVNPNTLGSTTTGGMKFREKEKKKLTILQFAIAKAEKEQLIANDSIITEAKALLSGMMKEELKAIIEIAKEKSDPAILQSAIAKAEKEQLMLADDTAVIAEAKAVLPVVELKAAMDSAK